jgi:hypothetical protein
MDAAVRTWSNAASDEWYTPASIVDRAHRVLGCIDLDPASSDAVERLIREHEAGRGNAAVVLVNLHRTGSAWFQELATRGHRCELRQRITYWRPDGASYRASHDDVVFYLGPKPRRFARWFSAFGVTAKPCAPPRAVTLRCSCGELLPVGRSDIRYCSSACRQRAYHQRKD